MPERTVFVLPGVLDYANKRDLIIGTERIFFVAPDGQRMLVIPSDRAFLDGFRQREIEDGMLAVALRARRNVAVCRRNGRLRKVEQIEIRRNRNFTEAVVLGTDTDDPRGKLPCGRRGPAVAEATRCIVIMRRVHFGHVQTLPAGTAVRIQHFAPRRGNVAQSLAGIALYEHGFYTPRHRARA